MSEPTPPAEHEHLELDARFWRRAIPAFVLIVLFVVFLIQNSEPVEIELLSWSATIRLAFVVIGAAIGGALLWALLGFARKRRSKR